MDEKKELERLETVNKIHRERVEDEISDVDADIAYSMLNLDKVHSTISKLTTARIFLFNQDQALNELENAKDLESKTAAYNKFMDLFITEQPKCNIDSLKSLVGYNIVKRWIENLFTWPEESNDKDLETVLSIIDKYYKMYIQ